MELWTYDQTKLDPKRQVGFTTIFGFLEDFLIFFFKKANKSTFAWPRQTINHHLSQISLGAIWANAWHFQGKTELKRPGAPKSRIAKNRHGLIFTTTPGNDSSECSKRWWKYFNHEVRLTFTFGNKVQKWQRCQIFWHIFGWRYKEVQGRANVL